MTVEQGAILKAVLSIDMPDTQVAQNVYYWELNGTNPIDDQDVMDAIKDGLEALYDELDLRVMDNVHLDNVKVNEMDWNPGEEKWDTGRFVGEDAIVDTFAGTGDMLPHAVAAVITAFTEDVKRRGRKFFAGFDDQVVDRSSWTGATITALVAAGVRWLADLVIAGGDHLVPGIPSNLGTWLPFISVLISSIAGSQRRRKPGLGI